MCIQSENQWSRLVQLVGRALCRGGLHRVSEGRRGHPTQCCTMDMAALTSTRTLHRHRGVVSFTLTVTETEITETHYRHFVFSSFLCCFISLAYVAISSAVVSFSLSLRFPVILPSRTSRNNTCRRTCPSHLRFRRFIVLILIFYQSSDICSSQECASTCTAESVTANETIDKTRHCRLRARANRRNGKIWPFALALLTCVSHVTTDQQLALYSLGRMSDSCSTLLSTANEQQGPA